MDKHEKRKEISTPDINLKLDKILNKVSELVKAQNFLSERYDDLLNTINKQTKANELLKKEISQCKKQNKAMASEMYLLKGKVNALEQSKISDNVIVRGLNINEDPIQAILKLSQIANVEMTRNDIVVANRRDYNGKTAIHAKFHNVDTKCGFVKAAKKKRISTAMYGYKGEAKPIFIDEHVTAETYKLFTQAKLLRKCGIKYIWISNGEVLVREGDNSKVTRIVPSSQITDIETQLALKTDKSNGRTDKPKQEKNNRTRSNTKAATVTALDGGTSDNEDVYSDAQADSG